LGGGVAGGVAIRQSAGSNEKIPPLTHASIYLYIKYISTFISISEHQRVVPHQKGEHGTTPVSVREMERYGYISMLRYWSSLRNSFLRTQFFVGRRSSSPANFPCARFLSFPAPFPCRVSVSKSTGILGIPHPPSLLSNTPHTHLSIYINIYLYLSTSASYPIRKASTAPPMSAQGGIKRYPPHTHTSIYLYI